MQGTLTYRCRTIDGPADDLLSIPEAAKYLRTSPKTLRRLIAEGQFPRPVRLPRGGNWCHWMDVVAFLHIQDRLQVGADAGSSSEAEQESEGTAKGFGESEVDRKGQARRGR